MRLTIGRTCDQCGGGDCRGDQVRPVFDNDRAPPARSMSVPPNPVDEIEYLAGRLTLRDPWFPTAADRGERRGQRTLPVMAIACCWS